MNQLIKNVRDDIKDSYIKLFDFFYMLEKENPNSYIEIKRHTESNIKYKFMKIGACINGFIKYIRLIVVDVIFIKKEDE